MSTCIYYIHADIAVGIHMAGWSIILKHYVHICLCVYIYMCYSTTRKLSKEAAPGYDEVNSASDLHSQAQVGKKA